jgi:hypothetical protein
VGVSSDGSTIVVGATASTTGQGGAYVFLKPEGGWATNSAFAAFLTAYYKPMEPQDFDGISLGVSSDASIVVIGTPFGRVGTNPDQGAAYVFVMPGGGWASTSTFTAELTASDGGLFDELGYSVGVTGNGSTIVAGAPMAEIGSNTQQGAAYVFVMPGGGWANSYETAKLTASDGALGDQLGTSVGVSSDGSTIAAGAPMSNIGSNPLQGAAYVFAPAVGGGWVSGNETAKLTASDGARDNLLGMGLGISSDGSTLVAGADGFGLNQGAAYVFDMPEDGWASSNETAKLTASNGVSDDFFGYSVGVSGDGMAVAAGAYLKQIGSITYQGAADVFLTVPTVTFTGASVSEPYSTQFTVPNATTNSSTSPVYTASGSCSNSGGTTTYTMTRGTGSCYEIATWLGTVDYASAKVIQRTTASKIAPTVTFTGAPASAAYQGIFTVASTTDSSSSPVYSASGPCTNVGPLYAMTRGNGTCTSKVSWVTDSDYLRASLTQMTTASKIGQTISFTTPAPSSAADHSRFTVAADSTSSLTVRLSVAAGSKSVCSLGTPTTVSGVTTATVTMLSGTGTCTIDAKQGGNNDYTAAAQAATSATATP